MSGLLALFLFSCAPPPLEVVVERSATEISVRATRPMTDVELRDGLGRVVRARHLKRPSTEVSLFSGVSPSTPLSLTVSAGSARRSFNVDPVAVEPVTLSLRLSPLSPELTLRSGDAVAVAVHAPRPVSLELRGSGPLSASLGVDDRAVAVALKDASAVFTVPLELVPGRPIWLTLLGRRYGIAPVLQAGRADVHITRVALPVSPSGASDGVRRADHLRLLGGPWLSLLSRLGLGYRASSEQAPWTYEGVELENRGDAPIDLLLSVRTLDATGQPHPAFASTLRGAPQERVNALLRLPAHRSARSVFPLYLKPENLGAEESVVRELSVYQLGEDAPIAQLRRPIALRRAQPWLALGLGLALLSSALAWLIGLTLGGRWIARATVSEVMTISTIAALHFVGGSAVQLLSLGVGLALGPFSAFLTGFPDQLLRTALLLTLLGRVPRVGAIALTLVIEQLLRAFSWGLQPLDLLLLGLSVFAFELMAWCVGLTRDPEWARRGRSSRLARVALCFVLANVLVNAAGLAVVSVLYRMYFSVAYVIALLLVPSGLCVLVSVPFSVDFADQMRRVQP